MKFLLKCSLTPGQFSDELGARGRKADGTEFSLFVPLENIQFSEPPTGKRPVEGWLHIECLGKDRNELLIKLPAESFESGRYITVSNDDVREEVCA